MIVNWLLSVVECAAVWEFAVNVRLCPADTVCAACCVDMLMVWLQWCTVQHLFDSRFSAKLMSKQSTHCEAKSQRTNQTAPAAAQ